MTRICIHVQYLKGIGHLQRIGLIAEAAVRHDAEVHIISGGLPLPSFRPAGAVLHPLPPLQAGPEGFRDLRDEKGQSIDHLWRNVRCKTLLKLFGEIKPDLLLIETFPFGRRMLGFELMPLLEAARTAIPKPVTVCSIRDILQENRKAGRTRETLTRLNDYFDAVLVHGDPDFLALDKTFPSTPDIRPPLYYTGIVAAPMPGGQPDVATPSDEIIVSIGGGAVGPRLLDAAIAARALLSPLADKQWRLITGPHLPEDDFNRLKKKSPPGVTVERFRSDFRALLGSAALSISYAGYNTVADILLTRTPAVLLCYSGEDGLESEQRLRAACLEKLGIARALDDSALTAETLAQAITAALVLKPVPSLDIQLDGAKRSAALLIELSKG